MADFDADGKLDLLWHNQTTGDLYVWLMDGLAVDGRLLPDAEDLRGHAVADPRASRTSSGDGQADVLWHHQGTSGDLYVWLSRTAR